MSEQRLREYIEQDKIYQEYKNSDKEPSDFERFCFVHCRDIENVLNEVEELRKENQQLKQKYEMQKDSNKLLCKAITCDDCDCKVCEAHKENIKYKSVLDEIREKIESKNNGVCFINGEEKPAYTFLLDFDRAREFVWDLLQILDKVKE